MPGETHVIVNGVDVTRVPLDVVPDPEILCFVGTFSWMPNIDGAEWFVHDVLPLLPERFRVRLVALVFVLDWLTGLPHVQHLYYVPIIAAAITRGSFGGAGATIVHLRKPAA